MGKSTIIHNMVNPSDFQTPKIKMKNNKLLILAEKSDLCYKNKYYNP